MAAPNRYRTTGLDETKKEIAAAPVSVRGWNFINPNAYPVYVKFYDSLLSNVTVGTTVPAVTWVVPASGYATLAPNGEAIFAFSTGLAIAATKLLADNDTTALDTNIHAEVYYA